MINWELNEIFEEAKAHRQSIVATLRKGTTILYSGVKIQKFGDRIEIMNMGKGGDYFKECTLEEYDYFYKYGWEKGVLQVAMSNCIHKLEIIEHRIKTEVNTRKNDKHIQNLKTRRENILNKYTKKKQKFNQLKSKQNGELF
tara:strand:- start:1351 stop:1776 length:426 start_codon:yes stop_codon:yes gene_type:complete